MIKISESINPSKINKLDLDETETYRSLRARIKIITPESKVFSVVSVSKGEGKTEVATKLANSMAFAGNKILLVDGNLRSVDLKRKFDIPTHKGLGNLLKGEVDGDDCIVSTMIDNLYLLPNIESTNISTEILEMADLKKILEILKENFDYVIIDTLAMEESMDAILLAKASDGALFVAVENETRIAKIRFFKDLLNEFQVKVVGAIINKVL